MANRRRLIKIDTMIVEQVVEAIEKVQGEKGSVMIAIDGRCASGKTTLAKRLADVLDCNIFSMDDFFLRPEQRTAERMDSPGGNVDRERFSKEVLIPLSKGEVVFYRAYDCHRQSLKEPVNVTYKKINIIEGSYSCHPDLYNAYDIHIFLDVSPEEQLERIRLRNGEEVVGRFKELWIPLEEKYFGYFNIKSKCELKFNT